MTRAKSFKFHKNSAHNAISLFQIRGFSSNNLCNLSTLFFNNLFGEFVVPAFITACSMTLFSFYLLDFILDLAFSLLGFSEKYTYIYIFFGCLFIWFDRWPLLILLKYLILYCGFFSFTKYFSLSEILLG